MRPQALPRVLGPPELAAVVGDLLGEAALHLRDALEHLAGDDLEVRAAADGAAHGAARSPRRRTCGRSRRGRPSRARAPRLGELGRVRRCFGMKRSIASSMTALVMTLWPFSSARRRMPVRAMPFTCGGHARHALLGLGRPADALLGAHVELGVARGGS